MRSMRRFTADTRRIETYPGGCDDPGLPDELLWAATVMRHERDAHHDPPSAEQVARVAEIMRTGRMADTGGDHVTLRSYD